MGVAGALAVAVAVAVADVRIEYPVLVVVLVVPVEGAPVGHNVADIPIRYRSDCHCLRNRHSRTDDTGQEGYRRPT